MSALTLDTHRTVKRLMEAGFSSDQAETVTDVLVETRAADLAPLATKDDLAAVKDDVAAVKDDLAAVEATLKADIRAVQADLRTVEATLKADIRTVEATLKADIRTVEATLSAKIAESGRATLQWTVGLLLAQSALIAGLIKLLAGH
jgi:hypothetical protein